MRVWSKRRARNASWSTAPPPTGSCCATGLSTFGSSRNKRLVGEGLQELSQRLNFRYVDGLAERVIFREFYPRGLTAVDDLDEITLGTRPTMSHATARLEMENLIGAILLGAREQSGDMAARDAA